MENVKAEAENRISDTVEETLILCAADASILRTKIIGGAPGDIEGDYFSFRENFDFLFTLSSSNKEIDSDLKKQIEVWLLKVENLDAKNVLNAIKMFNNYKDELFNNKVVVR